MCTTRWSRPASASSSRARAVVGRRSTKGAASSTIPTTIASSERCADGAPGRDLAALGGRPPRLRRRPLRRRSRRDVGLPRRSRRSGRVVAGVYANGGIVAAVCHGPAALVDVKLADGSYLVANHDVSAFTNAEEREVGLAEVVPFPLQSTLEERGARFQAGANWQSQVSSRTARHGPEPAVGEGPGVADYRRGGPPRLNARQAIRRAGYFLPGHFLPGLPLWATRCVGLDGAGLDGAGLDGVALDAIALGASAGVSRISMRRLRARPAGFLLLATGWNSP